MNNFETRTEGEDRLEQRVYNPYQMRPMSMGMTYNRRNFDWEDLPNDRPFSLFGG